MEKGGVRVPGSTPSWEAQRLQATYEEYRRQPSVQDRWRADNPGNQCILNERLAETRKLLQSHGLIPLTDVRLLDVGCGSGGIMVHLLAWGAAQENVYEIDLLPEHIEAARRIFPRAHFECSNAEALTWPAASFDLVVLSTVFSSILDEQMTSNVAKEVTRVLRPGGGVLWYDLRYDNPYNRNVRGVSIGRLKELFPGFLLDVQPVTLLPPLARRLGRLTKSLYRPLAAVPALRTHYLGLLLKP